MIMPLSVYLFATFVWTFVIADLVIQWTVNNNNGLFCLHCQRFSSLYITFLLENRLLRTWDLSDGMIV